MELVLVVVALALAGCWAGLHLAVRARRETATLRRINATLEARAEQRARDLQGALAVAEGQAAQVEAAHRAKTEFLASMSHELRTPLNAVIGFSDLMRMNEAQEPLTHRQHQAVEQIRVAGARLLTLVDEVLNLADIEGGRLALTVERVDPLLWRDRSAKPCVPWPRPLASRCANRRPSPGWRRAPTASVCVRC